MDTVSGMEASDRCFQLGERKQVPSGGSRSFLHAVKEEPRFIAQRYST